MTCRRSTPPAQCALPPGCGDHPQPDPLRPAACWQPDQRSGDHRDLRGRTLNRPPHAAVLRDEGLIFTVPQRGSYVR